MFGMSGSPESFESWVGGSREACELPRGPRAWGPLHRHEVHLSRQGARWEVRDEPTDTAVVHDDETVALRLARELARRAYADDGQPSCVKVLDDGTWNVVEIFGLLSVPAPLDAHP